MTAHHLLYNRNAHLRRRPAAALVLPAGAQARGAPAGAGRGGDLGQRDRFFLGTDSAPHAAHAEGARRRLRRLLHGAAARSSCMPRRSRPPARSTGSRRFASVNGAGVLRPAAQRRHGDAACARRGRCRRRVPFGDAELKPLRGGGSVGWRARAEASKEKGDPMGRLPGRRRQRRAEGARRRLLLRSAARRGRRAARLLPAERRSALAPSSRPVDLVLALGAASTSRWSSPSRPSRHFMVAAASPAGYQCRPTSASVLVVSLRSRARAAGSTSCQPGVVGRRSRRSLARAGSRAARLGVGLHFARGSASRARPAAKAPCENSADRRRGDSAQSELRLSSCRVSPGSRCWKG